MTEHPAIWQDDETRKEAARRLRAHARRAGASVETFLRWSYEIEQAGRIKLLEKVIIEASANPQGKGTNPHLLSVAREILSLDPDRLERCIDRRKWLDKQETRKEARFNLREAVLHTLDNEGAEAVLEAVSDTLARETGERRQSVCRQIIAKQASGEASAEGHNVINFPSA